MNTQTNIFNNDPRRDGLPLGLYCVAPGVGFYFITTMKTCFKCNKEKPLSDYYKHKKMGDGHLGKCKDCTKRYTREREEALRLDDDWVEKEKERSREKYHRLGYKERHKPTPEIQYANTKKYREMYPEKELAKKRSQRIRKEKDHRHHWSYNEDHFKDVIHVSMNEHFVAHRNMTYDTEAKMYRTHDGVLLETKEMHVEFIQSLGVNCIV